MITMEKTHSVGTGNLLIVLSNPPTTSGIRSFSRVELARDVLGYASVATANLFAIPTYRTNGVSSAGVDAKGWFDARAELENGLATADGVVLAYGCQEPIGSARQHFRSQLDWMETIMGGRGLPIWMIDGRPRHPSRWHRHTYAQHPTLTFREALPLVLRQVDPLG